MVSEFGELGFCMETGGVDCFGEEDNFKPPPTEHSLPLHSTLPSSPGGQFGLLHLTLESEDGFEDLVFIGSVASELGARGVIGRGVDGLSSRSFV